VAQASADAELEDLARRREGGEPLEHVLGWAELGEARVRVGPGVFVPRARSALLLEVAAERVRPGSVVVDLCCGSGAIGLALARRATGVELHAADLDPIAVGCARENLAGVGSVHEGDLFAPLPGSLRGRVDVLVANAPYVPTGELATLPREAREHEPALALDGGPDGLAPHRRIAAGAGEWLAPGGVLAFEAGVEQAAAARGLVEAAGLTAVVRVDEELDVAAVAGEAAGA
jgi:release factor glutamine methyltransferase